MSRIVLNLFPPHLSQANNEHCGIAENLNVEKPSYALGDILHAIVNSDGTSPNFNVNLSAKRRSDAKDLVGDLLTGPGRNQWISDLSCDLWDLLHAMGDAEFRKDKSVIAQVLNDVREHKGKLFEDYTWVNEQFATDIRNEIEKKFDVFIERNKRERVYVKWRGGGKDKLLSKIKNPIERASNTEPGFEYQYQIESDYKYWARKLLETVLVIFSTGSSYAE